MFTRTLVHLLPLAACLFAAGLASASDPVEKPDSPGVDRAFLCAEIERATACWSDSVADDLREAIAQSDHEFADEAVPLIVDPLVALYNETTAAIEPLCAGPTPDDPQAMRDAELQLACLAETAVFLCPFAKALKSGDADLESAILMTLFFPDYVSGCVDKTLYETYEDVLSARDAEAYSTAQTELVGSYLAGELLRDTGAQADHLDEARVAARACRVPRVLAWYLSERAGLQLDRGNLDRAEETLANAESMARMAPDVVGLSNVAILRGWVAVARKNPERAVRYFRESIRIQRETSSRNEVGDVVLNAVIGITLGRSGRCDEARPILAEARARIDPYLPTWHRVRADIESAWEECGGTEPAKPETPAPSPPSDEPETSVDATD